MKSRYTCFDPAGWLKYSLDSRWELTPLGFLSDTKSQICAQTVNKHAVL